MMNATNRANTYIGMLQLVYYRQVNHYRRVDLNMISLVHYRRVQNNLGMLPLVYHRQVDYYKHATISSLQRS